ncbi:hypothetical protein ASPZODRAFT_114013 [Penicilliopsis zonata CBS 506.65]|uniref:Carboxylesterase type B domain-containing protein n=1 Tax=Penicilliopsis zonata CBS 506.65 TaxID=1073090 RepID=A0A1L9SNP8_9EURO|nr:hypothetical protein ASPZODRAFT_114013 [Penicilliopsis zonata CBS 506.65]OJJ48733.1 hypothetical protein ASPZODRAFT_114013 [Penicilliopsis zonata CBS 506.65]
MGKPFHSSVFRVRVEPLHAYPRTIVILTVAGPLIWRTVKIENDTYNTKSRSHSGHIFLQSPVSLFLVFFIHFIFRMKYRTETAALMAGLLSTTHAALYETPIETEYGMVQGAAALNSSIDGLFPNWQNISAWKGIPYAASTAGKNRWRPPQPREAWNGTLDATSFSDACPDTGSSDTASEDCLTVNVWSPATSADENLPVMVWSYGAGFSSSSDEFDGSGLASKGIVFVSYNYRTGPFGWLALPELASESPTNTSGNYGLLDQIEVLKWVKANIANFGGNPDHVVSAGQSFGSGAVLHTINSPLAKGLIVGAIAESGIKDPYDPDYGTYGSNYVNMTYAESFSETYQSSLNCTTVEELRELTVDELLDGTGVDAFTGGFNPVLDNWAIPSTYFESLVNGPANDVPILVGNNRDEDEATYNLSMTVAEFKEDIVDTYGAYADQFLAEYNVTSDAWAGRAYDAISRDRARISTWLYSVSWAKTASSPVYTYEWDHAPPDQDSGAYHASEIFYTLYSLWNVDSTDWQPADYEIADKVSSYWANFVKTGNPNNGSSYTAGTLAHWPPSVATSNTTFNIGDSFEVVPLASNAQIETIFNWFIYDMDGKPY